MSVTRNALSRKSAGGMSNGQRLPKNNHVRKWPSSAELEIASKQAQIGELQTGIRWLEGERDRLSWLFEAMPVGVLVMDEHGNIKYFSSQLAKIVGYRRTILADGSLARLIVQSDVPVFLDHLRRCKLSQGIITS